MQQSMFLAPSLLTSSQRTVHLHSYTDANISFTKDCSDVPDAHLLLWVLILVPDIQCKKLFSHSGRAVSTGKSCKYEIHWNHIGGQEVLQVDGLSVHLLFFWCWVVKWALALPELGPCFPPPIIKAACSPFEWTGFEGSSCCSHHSATCHFEFSSTPGFHFHLFPPSIPNFKFG